MKYTITKTEEVEIVLTEPKYTALHGGIFYRFIPLSDGSINITRLSTYDSSSGNDLQVRTSPLSSDIEAIREKGGFVAISSDEFYSALNEFVSKYHLLPQTELV